MSEIFKNHPCFDDEARHKFKRVHLPVAPRCNIQCNFCNRKFDCVNESRPGVTSGILSPEEASLLIDEMVKNDPNLSVVGIAGPGDPFANPDETMKTLRLIRAGHPGILLCVASNGLNIKKYISELAELRVSHVTITINAVNPEIGEKIYSWMRYNKKVVSGINAASILLENQLEAVRLLKEHGITVKINSIIIPGINDFHIPEIAKKLSGMGADILNPLPLYPVAETAFENIAEPDAVLMKNIKLEVGKYIKMMHHCTRCRADAAGLLGENKTVFDMKEKLLKKHATINEKLETKRIAIASMEGILINQHLGEAKNLLIYESVDNHFSLIGSRNTPEKGDGDLRWIKLSEIISDCSMLLCSGAGSNPVNILKDKEIKVVITEGLINEVLNEIKSGAPLSKIERVFSGCGIECSGTGAGCG